MSVKYTRCMEASARIELAWTDLQSAASPLRQLASGRCGFDRLADLSEARKSRVVFAANRTCLPLLREQRCATPVATDSEPKS